eukprot:m.16591 g.16591  ORF g.16591 m.16591 type:complete len:625 (-) comp3401_c0_seq1:132-2006(-)
MPRKQHTSTCLPQQNMTESATVPATPPRMRQLLSGDYGSPCSGLKILSLLASPHQKGLVDGRRAASAPPPTHLVHHDTSLSPPPMVDVVRAPVGLAGRRSSIGEYGQQQQSLGHVPPPTTVGFHPVPTLSDGWGGGGMRHAAAVSPPGNASHFVAARGVVSPREMQWAPAPDTTSFPAPPAPRRVSTDSARSEGAAGKPKQSRKEKSLGLLSENFLRMFMGTDHTEICLDEVARELGVERRRIYDIVNVLEGVEVVMRKEKNRYTWLGLGGMGQTLSRLKALAGSSVVPDARKLATLEARRRSGASEASGTSSPGGSSPITADDNLTDKQKSSRSLGILAQRFVMMFMSSPTRVVRLDDAAECLVFQGCDEAKHKTKVRRLYDIANVLCSLRLIAKTSVSDTRAPKKPAFVWIGTDLDAVTPDPSGLDSPARGRNSDSGSGSNSRSRARKQSLLRSLDEETPKPKRSRTRLYSAEEVVRLTEMARMSAQTPCAGQQWGDAAKFLNGGTGPHSGGGGGGGHGVGLGPDVESSSRAHPHTSAHSAADTPLYRPPWPTAGDHHPVPVRRNVYGYPPTHDTSPQGKFSMAQSQEATPVHGKRPPSWTLMGSSPDAVSGDKRTRGEAFD